MDVYSTKQKKKIEFGDHTKYSFENCISFKVLYN